MGKRSSFGRIDKDLYRTIDPRASARVLPFVLAERIRSFVEPCYGYGDLPGPFTRAGLEIRGRYDLAPRGRDVVARDGRALTFADLNGADAIITNPPWSRALLHALIARWSAMVPVWLLFDADWAHTGQARHLMALCTDVVAAGRLTFIPGTFTGGKDNCAWYRFHKAGADPRFGTRFWPLDVVPDFSRTDVRPAASPAWARRRGADGWSPLRPVAGSVSQNSQNGVAA